MLSITLVIYREIKSKKVLNGFRKENNLIAPVLKFLYSFVLYLYCKKIIMNRKIILLLSLSVSFISCRSQTAGRSSENMRDAAVSLLQTFSSRQRGKVQFSFMDEERYNWHFVPIARKGIPLKELNDAQREAVLNLLHTALSDTGYKKTTS